MPHLARVLTDELLTAADRDPEPLPTIWAVPDDLWARIAPVLVELDPPKGTGRPRIDPRAARDAILYRLRTGVQWNHLPKAFPDDSSVHRTFQRWVEGGVFARIWAEVLAACEELRGAVDRPKVTARRPQHLCLDRGYDVDAVWAEVVDRGYEPHIRMKGLTAVLPDDGRWPARRWVVERTLAWLSKCRAILIRWDKKAQNYLGLLHFACALLWYRRLHRLTVSR